MEFIMTYGWALLVVMIVVGALVHFGIMDPKQFINEKCTFPSGLYCEDFYLTNTGWNFYFQNGKGRGIIINSILVEGAEAGNPYSCNVSLGTTIANGDSQTFDYPNTCADQGLTLREKYRFDVLVNYTFDGGVYPHVESGELIAVVN